MTMSKKKKFDFETFESGFADKLKDTGSLLGKDGALTPLIKHLLESALEGEMDAHLEEGQEPNRRNGKGKKRVRTPHGPVDIQTPRDRNSSFEPELLPKRQTVLGVDLDRQVLALYARGSSYEDIRSHLSEMYDLDVSPATLSRVTDRIWPQVQEWRSRPLEAVYPFIWMDALHVKIREEGRVRTRAVYCVLGVNEDGMKDLLGLYIGENEGAKFWFGVLSDLRDRGVEDILICCIDNLKGFAEAVETAFPRTIVQLCVVHQIRNSFNYVNWQDSHELMRDLKRVYKASTLTAASVAMDEFEAKWGKKYPKVIQSWRRNWDRLMAYYEFSPAIRRMIYTTNIIESFHRQMRRVIKTKGAFTNEEALFKLLYLAQERVTAKWKKPTYAWNQVKAELLIIFEDRLNLTN